MGCQLDLTIHSSCSVLFLVYVVVGMVIKIVKYGARDLEIIPNYGVWLQMPSLFYEGVAFTLSKISRGKICTPSNDF